MRALVISLLVLAAGASSCAPTHTAPVAPPRPMTPSESNRQAVWDASLRALAELNFVPDRQDRRAGVISTEPLTGPQWFEFWRGDAVRLEDRVESSLQTVHRTVTVTISPAGPEGTFQAHVEVAVSRSDRPTRELTSTSEAYRLFMLPGTHQRPSKLLMKAEAPKPEDMVALGRDAALEERIADRIRTLSGQPARAAPDSPAGR